MLLKTVYISSILLIVWTCSSPTDSEDNGSYTPISIGDMTQRINLYDSSTTLISIVGKTKRADGETAYIGEIKYSMKYDTVGFHIIDTLYYAISNGYYTATYLEEADTSSTFFEENPFREQRIAKSFPNDGDRWIKMISLNNSDYYIAEKIENFQTIFGSVDEVFAFQAFEEDDYPGRINYYGKNLGWIGSADKSSELLSLCSYKKISGKIYGNLWPEKPFEIKYLTQLETLANKSIK